MLPGRRCRHGERRADGGQDGRGRYQAQPLGGDVGAAPHFHGHRQRLRERLIAAGADNLPDYELMEVLLFAGNPRGDTKLAGQEG